MGAFAIRIEDVKKNKVLVDGIENCLSAELLLPTIIHNVYMDWRKEPNRDSGSTIPPLAIDYLGVRYTFLDHYWD